MKLKSILAAAVLAGSSFGALAVSVFPIAFLNGAVSFGNTPIVGAFTNEFTFTVPDLADLTTGSISSAVNDPKDIDFTSIKITGSDASMFSFTQALGDPNEFWTLAGAVLHSGVDYTLTIKGIQSNDPASYSGQMTITAIPEPGTYALLLAGLAAVTFVARRRRPA